MKNRDGRLRRHPPTIRLTQSLKTKKPVTYVTGFVATIELHSDQIWRDLGAFYSLIKVLERFLKIK